MVRDPGVKFCAPNVYEIRVPWRKMSPDLRAWLKIRNVLHEKFTTDRNTWPIIEIPAVLFFEDLYKRRGMVVVDKGHVFFFSSLNEKLTRAGSRGYQPTPQGLCFSRRQIHVGSLLGRGRCYVRFPKTCKYFSSLPWPIVVL